MPNTKLKRIIDKISCEFKDKMKKFPEGNLYIILESGQEIGLDEANDDDLKVYGINFYSQLRFVYKVKQGYYVGKNIK